MFNANNHNLEETGKNAAEQFFDESLIPSWHQLEKKLDLELPVKKNRRQVFAFWIFFTLLFASFLYIGLEGNNPKKMNNYRNETTIAKDNQNAQEKDYIATFNTLVNERDSLKIQLNQPPGVVYKNSTDKSGNGENLYKLSDLLSTQTSLELDNTIMGNKPTNTKRSFDEKILKAEQSGTRREKIENFNSVSSVAVKVDGIKREKEVAIIKVVTSFESDNTLGKIENADSLISEKGKTKRINDNTDTKTAKKHNAKHGFTIAAIVGTNINSVGFNKFSKGGVDYGLLIGYRVSPKLEIKTGVIFSRKYFTTSGKNISFDSGKLNLPAYTNIKLEGASGYCRFLEIPVMLYYSFPSKSKTHVYAGAGFSVNKMRMEKIHYSFLVNSSTLVERTHTGAYHNVKGNSTSVTSNISFGLKHQLSRQWSLAFEPYLRIPLTKVNDSDLKLTTFGASASLILNLPNKKKK